MDEKGEIKILKDVNLPKEFINSDGNEYVFEYIDCKEKLFLSLFFESLLDNSSLDLENYIALLFKTYSKNNSKIQQLLGQIESMQNIPIEILSKYFVRLYSCESEFNNYINKDLRLGKMEKYLPYIKTLYQGLELNSLPLLSGKCILYRSSIISLDEFNKITNYLKKKIERSNCKFVFAKPFLSFSKDRKVAEEYLRMEKINTNFIKVFFILDIDMDINSNYCLNTHCDLESISFYQIEKEVLFFPFSAFEIKEIREISINNVRCYQINLLYLGKYLINNLKDEMTIPDSEFKMELFKSGLIEKDSVGKPNFLFEKYKEYKEGLKSKK